MTETVTVLMGGWSSEREVSLSSGQTVAKALTDAGLKVTAIDVERDIEALIRNLTPRPDVVFNALHGQFGEDGCVQALLNMLEVRYTHSGLLASAMAMHKPTSKRLFAAAGIRVPEHVIADKATFAAGPVMELPYVIKPVNEGSSVGVRIVPDETEVPDFQATGWPYAGSVMVEPYIPGHELTVAVMGDKALAVTEMVTDRKFYDYRAKYDTGGSHHVLPAEIDAGVYDEALRTAVLAHEVLGCRGVSRADFRYDGKDLYLLETNTQPGMTPTSLVPEQADHVGVPFQDLVVWMVENAEYDR